MPPKLHADELDIDDGLVRQLLREQFPQWAGLPLEPVASSGTVNVVYRLGRGMLVRLPRLTRAADDVYREQEWLPRLASHLPIAVPTLLGAGAPGAGYPCPWSVFDWLDGGNPIPGRVHAPELLARDLTRFVRALREVDTEGARQRHIAADPLRRWTRASGKPLRNCTARSTPRRRRWHGKTPCARRIGRVSRCGFMPTSYPETS